ncbi:hypothetical protein [Amycolatopsis sp. CA-230715]|uniref:hypothetical protein n=1 Tax=Amycolatopsis sp. CA-230715 TaxID=2745196 RepID=UPI001C00BF7C|nr:hypothetical protein [Amycolatopsis sp. CA-230715]QWF86085.1 hypothetical protein HUW46_09566 [Amycolatopsis sp. CA-230715]
MGDEDAQRVGEAAWAEAAEARNEELDQELKETGTIGADEGPGRAVALEDWALILDYRVTRPSGDVFMQLDGFRAEPGMIAVQLRNVADAIEALHEYNLLVVDGGRGVRKIAKAELRRREVERENEELRRREARMQDPANPRPDTFEEDL